MAGSDKTVKVTLVAQTAPYAKGMNDAASATRKLGSDIDGVDSKQKGFADSAGQSTSALKGMALAGAAVAGTALVGFLTDSVKAAGDLQQSIGGVDAVFKETADQVHAFGETSAEAVGLSRNEFNSLITVTGAMLKNKGLEDFTQKSIDLVKVGADLAATYGGSAKDAVEALNAAMRGESDPIERYGISLNETAVKAELAAKGMDGLTGATLEQAKAQARIDIITRQSADALGSFAREADTLQGQQQRLNAEWEDAKASLGGALLPALTSVMSALRDGVDATLAIASAFGELPAPIKIAAGALIAFHLLRGPVGGFLTATIGQVKTLASTLKGGGIAGGAKAAGGALMGAFGGPLGIAVGLGAAALTHWWQEAEKSNQIGEALVGTLDKTTGAFTAQSQATIKDTLLGDLSTEDIKRMQELGISFDDLASAALKGGPELERVRGQLDGLRNFDWLFLKDDADIIDGVTSSLGRAADGAERSKILFGELPSPANASADAISKIADAAAASADGVLAQADAAAKAADSIDVLTVSQNANREATDILRDASKDLATALLEVKAAAGDADAAEIAYQDSLDKANERVAKRIELEKELKNAGGTSDRTRELQADLAKETDAKKRAKIQEQLAKSQARDARNTTEEQKRIREELEKYTLTLDINTEAGRANRTALLDLKDDAIRRAEANLKEGDSVAAVTKSMATAREEFINTAIKMGASKKEAKALADEYGLTKGTVDELNTALGEIPAETKVRVDAETAAAKTAINGVNAMLTALENRRIVVPITAAVGDLVGSVNNVGSLFGWKPVRKAAGGYISGPGTGTSDSIPALLSNGEYVLKAAAVAKYGKRQLDDLNAMRFAQGGLVSRMPQSVRVAPSAASGDQGPRNVINMQTNDPVTAAREVYNELEWRAVNG